MSKKVKSCQRIFTLLMIGLMILCLQSCANIDTVAGTGTAGYSGDGGPADAAQLDMPSKVAVDNEGNLIVADTENHTIREVNAATGVITTIAGTGVAGNNGDDIPATEALLDAPQGVVTDSAGNVYIADTGSSLIRKIDSTSGDIVHVAGNGEPEYGGDGGLAVLAAVSSPEGLAIDSEDNLYIADTGNHVVRKIDGEGIITTVAGVGLTSGYNGDDIPAIEAWLDSPSGVALDGEDNLYIADTKNHRIRRVDAAKGEITTVAGDGAPGYSGDGALAVLAQLDSPRDVFADPEGNLAIADTGNDVVRAVEVETGRIFTIAGTGIAGYSGDEGLAIEAELNSPSGVFADFERNRLYIADTVNNVIRILTPLPPTVTTVSPDRGPTLGGTEVTILGTGFSQVTNVLFGTTPAASFIRNSDTSITAVSPPGKGTVHVRVVTAFGTSEATSADEFTYFSLPPVITSVSPDRGPTLGGTEVTILGTSFNQVTNVLFGTTPAASFIRNSDTFITAVSPPGTGTVHVRVVTAFGTSEATLVDEFTYFSLPPVITSISPDRGPTLGGTEVTILGTGFNQVTNVLFGTTPAASFIRNSDTSITAVSSPGAGTVHVRVVTAFGTSEVTSADEFTYLVKIRLFPPRHLRGKQVKNRFATQTDVINVLTWDAPSKGEVPVAYRIYRDAALTKLLATVKANRCQLIFKEHNCKKDCVYTYFVVSIDGEGNQSRVAKVKVGN